MVAFFTRAMRRFLSHIWEFRCLLNQPRTFLFFTSEMSKKFTQNIGSDMSEKQGKYESIYIAAVHIYANISPLSPICFVCFDIDTQIISVTYRHYLRYADVYSEY